MIIITKLIFTLAFVVYIANASFSSLAEFKKKIQEQVGESVCYDQWLGDGSCDRACNTAEHSFDGGDCSSRFQSVSLFGDDHESGFTLAAESIADHHVGKYFKASKKTRKEDRSEVVLRRGVEFTITIVPKWYEKLSSVFVEPEHFTEYKLKDGTTGSCTHPDMTDKNRITCDAIPFTANVGRQEISFKQGRGFKDAGTVIIIFNPYHSDSPVYMSDSRNRKEYVEEQTGRTYYGDIDWNIRKSSTQNGVSSDSWAYHQYDPSVLDALALFIDKAIKSKSSLKYIDKSSPIGISRHLTDVLSATTRRRIEGLLEGKWPGENEKDPYKDGKDPGFWTGSRAIFTQWLRTGETVKYGQCWVFGGVLTTALRALGIPSRQLTTFRSGHDTQTSPGVFDKIIHYGGKTGESIWNYHVWVDAWFSRPDLPTKKKNSYDWNAVDATPQESSYDGEYKMGPAYIPFVATNTNQDNKKNFDNQFVIGEVNSIHRFDNGDDVSDVGRKVVTKKRGTNRYGKSGEYDLTSIYKHCETPYHEVENDVCIEKPVPETNVHFFLEMEASIRKSRAALKHSRKSVDALQNEEAYVSDDDVTSPPVTSTTPPTSPISKLRKVAHASIFATRAASLTAKVHDTTQRELYGKCLKSGTRICSTKNGEDCNRIHVSGSHVMGDDIHVEFKSTSSAAVGDIKIVVEAVSNNGQPIEHNPITEKNTASFVLTPHDYAPFVNEAATLKIIATSQDNGVSHYHENMIELMMPKLSVDISEDRKSVVISTKNPLPIPLTNLVAKISDDTGDRTVEIEEGMSPTQQDWSVSIPSADIDEGEVVFVSLNCDEIFAARGWNQDSSVESASA